MSDIQHSENEALDLEEEFFSFLMKAKEHLSRLSQDSDDRKDSTDGDEESGLCFMNSVADTKGNLPILVSETKNSQKSSSHKDTAISAIRKKLYNSASEEYFETKENCSRLSQKSDNHKDISDDEESDLAFLKFLTDVKKDLNESEKDDSLQDATDDEESDLTFMKFITEMKKDLPLEFETENALTVPKMVKCVTSDEKLSNDVSVNLSDMEAEAQTNFKRKREMFTQKLYDFFNRKIFNCRLPQDMALIWRDSLRSTAGMFCSVRNKETNGYSSRIELSTKVLTSFDRLRDTLLHEMCHAAVWIVNKQRDKHGPLWQTWASRCNLVLPQVKIPTRCHNYEISYRFLYKCKKCSWKQGRHTKCPNVSEAKCPKCKGSIYLVKS